MANTALEDLKVVRSIQKKGNTVIKEMSKRSRYISVLLATILKGLNLTVILLLLLLYA